VHGDYRGGDARGTSASTAVGAGAVRPSRDQLPHSDGLRVRANHYSVPLAI
jgi:hypothetical protein